VDVARSAGAEMIVIASRRQAARLAGAAVSQQVLRNAPCPVLVVPAAARGL
jgi:nucleotide-binding universal stress UspA family protein